MKNLSALMAARSAGLRLHLSVLLWRHGALGAAALLVLMLSALLGGWAGRALDEQEAALRARLRESDQSIQDRVSLTKPPAWRQTDPAQELRRVLGGAGPGGRASGLHGAEVVAMVMDRRGLTWASTDYRETLDRPTGLRRVQMQVAVVAPYPQVRDLVEDLLRQMPRASVDALSLVREGAAQSVPTSRLTLSLWSLPPQGEVAP